MNSINAFITSFCVSGIVLGLLFLLVPKGALNKAVKYIFCLCFVCCIAGSIANLSSPEFIEFKTVKNQDFITEKNAAITAQAVFCEALKSQNINFRKITVDTNKLNDDSITITKVTVYTTEDKQKILDIIGDEGYEVVIINE